jgi:hypothetical protein
MGQTRVGISTTCDTKTNQHIRHFARAFVKNYKSKIGAVADPVAEVG